MVRVLEYLVNKRFPRGSVVGFGFCWFFWCVWLFRSFGLFGSVDVLVCLVRFDSSYCAHYSRP